jgi:hypothetical protein
MDAFTHAFHFGNLAKELDPPVIRKDLTGTIKKITPKRRQMKMEPIFSFNKKRGTGFLQVNFIF